MVIKPPSIVNQMMEGRVVAEAATLIAQLPLLRLQSPRGSGPVVVLPGFMADDNSTLVLRRFIASLGYTVQGWELGVNRGDMTQLLAAVEALIARVADDEGEPVQLVGWSRGGVLAREVARDRADLVRRVITMGSPVVVGPRASSIPVEWIRRQTGVTRAQLAALMNARQVRSIQVPIVAIYSKTDGVVAWEACVDRTSPNVEHHEVWASHIGMGSNAAVFRLIGRALAGELQHPAA